MSIQYPEFFEGKLGESRAIRSAIDGTVSDFSEWLLDSKLPFFTDYTDHGPEHLNGVLTTAAALIDPAAKAHVSPEDAGIDV